MPRRRLANFDGRRLQRVREEHGYTRAMLAAWLHVSAESIAQWERGQHTPTPRYLRPMAAELHIPVDELLGSNPVRKMSDLRVRAGLELADVARYLGVTETTVSAIERGLIELKTSRTAKLAALYGVSPSVVTRAWGGNVVPLKDAVGSAASTPKRRTTSRRRSSVA